MTHVHTDLGRASMRPGRGRRNTAPLPGTHLASTPATAQTPLQITCPGRSPEPAATTREHPNPGLGQRRAGAREPGAGLITESDVEPEWPCGQIAEYLRLFVPRRSAPCRHRTAHSALLVDRNASWASAVAFGCPDMPVVDNRQIIPPRASSNARQTSVMSIIPMRPASSTTGRCRKRPVIMVLAASRMLAVALMTLRRVVIRS